MLGRESMNELLYIGQLNEILNNLKAMILFFKRFWRVYILVYVIVWFPGKTCTSSYSETFKVCCFSILLKVLN